jgi:hypothetical protein
MYVMGGFKCYIIQQHVPVPLLYFDFIQIKVKSSQSLVYPELISEIVESSTT